MKDRRGQVWDMGDGLVVVVLLSRAGEAVHRPSHDMAVLTADESGPFAGVCRPGVLMTWPEEWPWGENGCARRRLA